MWLDPSRERSIIICPPNDAMPYVKGPTSLQGEWYRPEMERFTFGLEQKPEYCFSIIDGVGIRRKIVTTRFEPDVEHARQRFAAASPPHRAQALLALQERAKEVLNVCDFFGQRGITYETMDMDRYIHSHTGFRFVLRWSCAGRLSLCLSNHTGFCDCLFRTYVAADASCLGQALALGFSATGVPVSIDSSICPSAILDRCPFC